MEENEIRKNGWKLSKLAAELERQKENKEDVVVDSEDGGMNGL